jgi:AcrR family transcriptional regulator
MKDTKEIILKTAYNLFLYNNYEAVTINTILKATGLAKGGLYHYFSSKEELFIAVVDRFMLENRADATEEPKSFREFIQGSIEILRKKITKLAIENTDPHNDIPINYLSLIVAAYRYYPGYTEKGKYFFKSQVEKVEEMLRKGVESGELRKDIDIDVSATNYTCIVTGIVNNMIRGGSMIYALDMLERQYMEFYKYIKA